VKVRRAIELSFGVVSGVGPGIHVLDGGPRASRGRGCFWHGFGHFSASGHALVSIGVMTLRNTFDSCVKSWQYFRTHGILLNSVLYSLSSYIVRFKIQVGVDAKFTCKYVSKQTQHAHCDLTMRCAAAIFYHRPRFRCQHARAVRSQ